MDLNKIYLGNSLEVLKTFPSNSVNCVITSPPYWSLRDYGTSKWVGGDENCDHKVTYNNTCNNCGAKKIDNQLGLEPTVAEYINKLCNIFDEVKRVLRDDGVCFVNLGDTYASKGGPSRHRGYKDPKYANGRTGTFDEPSTYKQENILSKSLCQIPSRYAIEMTNRGWILRNEIIWHKPNKMPESAKDRFTADFEKVFFFVKNEKYYFNQLLEPYMTAMNRWGGDTLKPTGKSTWDEGTNQTTYRTRNMRPNPLGRNKRCVWTIPTKPYKGAHFAVFPTALVEPLLLAGCPDNGIVLDPFIGAGTVGVVASKNNKQFIGIELKEEYIKLANERILRESATKN